MKETFLSSFFRLALLALVLLTFAVWAAAPAIAGTIPPGWNFIGTFEINYYFNAGGCPGPPLSANPFGCYMYQPPPGPYFLSLDPGNYKIVTVDFSGGGGNPRAFEGNAGGGDTQILNPIIGDKISVKLHTGDQLVLFQHDWMAWDNPSNIWLKASVYSVPEPAAFVLLGCGIAGISALRRRWTAR